MIFISLYRHGFERRWRRVSAHKEMLRSFRSRTLNHCRIWIISLGSHSKILCWNRKYSFILLAYEVLCLFLHVVRRRQNYAQILWCEQLQKTTKLIWSLGPSSASLVRRCSESDGVFYVLLVLLIMMISSSSEEVSLSSDPMCWLMVDHYSDLLPKSLSFSCAYDAFILVQYLMDIFYDHAHLNKY